MNLVLIEIAPLLTKGINHKVRMQEVEILERVIILNDNNLEIK